MNTTSKAPAALARMADSVAAMRPERLALPTRSPKISESKGDGSIIAREDISGAGQDPLPAALARMDAVEELVIPTAGAGGVIGAGHPDPAGGGEAAERF